jgi:hypothetical protein
MKKIISYTLLLLMLSCNLSSQTTVKVDLLKKSWLSINGTSNIISFKLIHNGEKLLGKSLTLTTTQNQNKLFLSQNQLSILVKNFSSDNVMARRDFLKLIKSDIYPTINVQLNYLETANGKKIEANSKGDAYVNITITGVTKQYHIPVTSNKEGEFVLVDGNKSINIRDFGLTPPVEMMGLLKVSEWIDLDFHLICKITMSKTPNDLIATVTSENTLGK